MEHITAAPKLPVVERQQNFGGTACSGWLGIVSSCSRQTPNLESLSFEQQASCLCYSGSTWVPAAYDQNWASCLKYLSTDDPAYYSANGGDNVGTAPCHVLGNFRKGPVASGQSQTGGGGSSGSAAGGGSVYPPCFTWDSLSSSCAAQTSGFTDLDFSSQARCLCFSSSTFAPGMYDGPYGSCILYLSSLNPSRYSQTSTGPILTTPCVRIANELTGTTTSPTVTPTKPVGNDASLLGPPLYKICLAAALLSLVI